MAQTTYYITLPRDVIFSYSWTDMTCLPTALPLAPTMPPDIEQIALTPDLPGSMAHGTTVAGE